MTVTALATGADTAPYRPVEATEDAWILADSWWESLYGILVRTYSPRTGQDTMRRRGQAAVRNRVALIDLPTGATGYGWISAPVLHAFVVDGDPQDLDETDTREAPVELASEPAPEIIAAVEAVQQVRERESPEAVALARLIALTGLEMDKLALLLGVSRTTLYAWRAGTKPRGSKRDHLLQVLAVMEEVAARLGPPREVAAWLLTPSAASNRSPLEVLREHRYDLCRGMLTRRRTQRPALPQRAPRRLSGADLRNALEQVSSRPSLEDYEVDDEPGE